MQAQHSCTPQVKEDKQTNGKVCNTTRMNSDGGRPNLEMPKLLRQSPLRGDGGLHSIRNKPSGSGTSKAVRGVRAVWVIPHTGGCLLSRDWNHLHTGTQLADTGGPTPATRGEPPAPRGAGERRRREPSGTGRGLAHASREPEGAALSREGAGRARRSRREELAGGRAGRAAGNRRCVGVAAPCAAYISCARGARCAWARAAESPAARSLRRAEVGTGGTGCALPPALVAARLRRPSGR